MKRTFYYQTITDAISKLKQEGFNIDFNSERNCLDRHIEEFKAQDFEVKLICHIDFNSERNCLDRHIEEFKAQNFEIKRISNYKGSAAPAEDVVIYAIESKSGLKGTLVARNEGRADPVHAQVLTKLCRSKCENM